MTLLRASIFANPEQAPRAVTASRLAPKWWLSASWAWLLLQLNPKCSVISLMLMAVLAKELAGMQALVNKLLSPGAPEVLETALS